MSLPNKEKNFSEWYQEVIQKAELIEYTPISGCYVLRPRAYEIWENIQSYFDKKIKKDGVKNAYFPLLIPENLLKKESSHIKGFSPEVAWVTQGGSSKLNEKLAIRPTSESIMYPSYSKWIRSHKDLPLRLNQWNSVLRWEFKHPMPLIRFREFLWQEGHSAFSSKKEADQEALKILEFYADVHEELLAIPVLKGKKSEKEKFAGADYTLSIECFLPNGRATQDGTSHSLGQNFSKAFDIKFKDKDEKEKYVWQNSWGLSARAIGVMVMTHGDNKGLVIPPYVATNKVVIIPIIFKKDKDKVIKKTKEIFTKLTKYNPILDDREEYSPGWKFADWELKGIPVRIEIGPKDIDNNQVIIVKRHNNEKEIVKIKDLDKKIQFILDEIQHDLFTKAKKFLDSSIVEVKTWSEFVKNIKNGKLVLSSWCGTTECEDYIKDKTEGAKSINMPLNQKAIKEKCIHCNKDAKIKAYFAKSY